jgi:hypothetical protein
MLEQKAESDTWCTHGTTLENYLEIKRVPSLLNQKRTEWALLEKRRSHWDSITQHNLAFEFSCSFHHLFRYHDIDA